jgi:poly-gamma-glutamate capsule biosynthesis protein CapA/YwtB (metallophosphatase superfamily)
VPIALPESHRAHRTGVLVASVAAAVGLLVGAVACSPPGTTNDRLDGATPAGQNGAAHDTEAATTTTTTKPLRHFTIAASGDILAHSPVYNRARANAGGNGYDFRPMFSAMKDEISAADLAICHQETPLSATDTGLSGYPVFNSPKEIGVALADAGFDGCDTASNHSIDQGLQGVTDTGAVLDAAGLKHTGSFATAEQAVDGGGVIYETHTRPAGSGEPNARAAGSGEVAGVKVGHLAYTYGTNGIPPAAPWELNLNNVDTMLANAHALKAKGAEVVVLSVHWGAEYQAQPTPDQITLAHQLLDSPDIDLILGDHVHVVQPMEKYNGKYVIYGMGNFLSNQSPASDRTLIAATQDGGLYTWTFDEQAAGGFVASKSVYTPTYVRRPDYVIIATSPSVQGDSFTRTVKAINLLGAGSNDSEPTTGPVPPGLIPTTTTAAPTTVPTTKAAAAVTTTTRSATPTTRR